MWSRYPITSNGYRFLKSTRILNMNISELPPVPETDINSNKSGFQMR